MDSLGSQDDCPMDAVLIFVTLRSLRPPFVPLLLARFKFSRWFCLFRRLYFFCLFADDIFSVLFRLVTHRRHIADFSPAAMTSYESRKTSPRRCKRDRRYVVNISDLNFCDDDDFVDLSMVGSQFSRLTLSPEVRGASNKMGGS